MRYTLAGVLNEFKRYLNALGLTLKMGVVMFGKLILSNDLWGEIEATQRG
jgi:hypothetical protein